MWKHSEMSMALTLAPEEPVSTLAPQAASKSTIIIEINKVIVFFMVSFLHKVRLRFAQGEISWLKSYIVLKLIFQFSLDRR